MDHKDLSNQRMNMGQLTNYLAMKTFMQSRNQRF